jgi:hypothetical protein
LSPEIRKTEPGYTIRSEDGILQVTYLEPPLPEVILSSFHETVTNHPDSARRLFDLSCGVEAEFDREQIRRIAQTARELPKPESLRVAIVASDDLVYGLSRMYEAFREDPHTELRVFRSKADAAVWLSH